MTRGELLERFQTEASEITEREISVTEDTAIADLGMDSLSLLELVGTFERTLSIRIDSEDLADVTTVAELLDVVEARRTRVAC
ncbi:MAG: acyl carrier protein [Myxococcota bacterium]